MKTHTHTHIHIHKTIIEYLRYLRNWRFITNCNLAAATLPYNITLDRTTPDRAGSDAEAGVVRQYALSIFAVTALSYFVYKDISRTQSTQLVVCILPRTHVERLSI